MRFRGKKGQDPRMQRKEGWDLLIRDYELKKKNETSRAAQRRLSMGLGHHLARAFKGHV